MDQYTNAAKVYRNFVKFGFKKDGSQLKQSTRQGKKFMVLDPNTNKWVHFGAMGYEDYTVHNDKIRRKNIGVEWVDLNLLINILLVIYH